MCVWIMVLLTPHLFKRSNVISSVTAHQHEGVSCISTYDTIKRRDSGVGLGLMKAAALAVHTYPMKFTLMYFSLVSSSLV